MSDNSSNSGRLGLFSLLGMVFIVLKICHVINWSWWWVTLPFWGGAALVGLIVVLGAMLGAID